MLGPSPLSEYASEIKHLILSKNLLEEKDNKIKTENLLWKVIKGTNHTYNPGTEAGAKAGGSLSLFEASLQSKGYTQKICLKNKNPQKG